MLQFAQYLNFKYFEVIPLLFCLLAAVIFIQHIINSFKNTTTPENTDSKGNTQKLLKGQNTKLNKISALTTNKIIPIIFVAFFLFWTLINYIPVILYNALPADSEQSLTIKNPQDNQQTIALLGRLSYSNDWKPIIPYSPLIQHSQLLKLKAKSEIDLKIRTGVNDIDYLMIVNLTNCTSYRNSKGITLQIPRNKIIVYADVMNELKAKPSILLLSSFLNIVLYFTAIIACLSLFFKVFYRLTEKKIVNIILCSIAVAIPTTACGFALWWNIETALYFI